MQQTLMLELAPRKNAPDTSIYTEIHCLSGELGQRAIILMLPGGPGNDHTMYDVPGNSLAETLLPYADIILFDPCGCGSSAKSKTEFCGLDQYIADVESIREHFQIQNDKFILLGASYGAIAALGYATQFPERLKQLILICGVASGDFLEEARQNLCKMGTAAQQYQGNKFLSGELTGATDEYTEYYRTMGPLYSLKFQPDTPTPPLTNLDLVKEGVTGFLRQFDFCPQLSEIKCQTLILAGADDWIADQKQSQTIHNGIADSELVIFADCSHLIWVDQWEACMRTIINFLSKVHLAG